ncbi:MAG: SDR family oxidoreductase [Chitinophagaceae bacterium]|jgi:NAD(P)-dependent dehydrogenase (short-subunit alcohol dehydrogenase family)|nr:SDR family oxidoreductase [Chitinophagaceae bacterium]MCA6470481.1 SDR family oxidoreductase [Chitinophagaceae bacterium]MCA6477680.1 SDR family oxidoreductase [Chitinophagaceae bacterium]MCA6480305.1 SDR family oxidoreductase [Chitinophagaceae bacterium]MCA6484740.1 SDR family oxidoreductase [Chitinophagaceae bacterium]
MYQLNNKVAIVTGSGRHKGIGEAIVLRLAAEGCRVVISDIGQPKGNEFSAQHIGVSEEMQQIANACRALGAEVLTIPCDVRIENECQQLMAATVESFGQVDILVNNAGVGYLMEPFTEFKESSWDAVLDVNLKGAFLCSKHAAIQMIQQGNGGSIINIASQAAKSGFPFAAAYTASKHGLVGLTRSNAVELGKHKIRVNAVCPNHITTGLGHWQNSFFSEKLGMDYATYLQSIVQKNPLGRTGLTEDIAKAVAFLCSEESAYITGEAMNVSGGEEYH